MIDRHNVGESAERIARRAVENTGYTVISVVEDSTGYTIYAKDGNNNTQAFDANVDTAYLVDLTLQTQWMSLVDSYTEELWVCETESSTIVVNLKSGSTFTPGEKITFPAGDPALVVVTQNTAVAGDTTLTCDIQFATGKSADGKTLTYSWS